MHGSSRTGQKKTGYATLILCSGILISLVRVSHLRKIAKSLNSEYIREVAPTSAPTGVRTHSRRGTSPPVTKALSTTLLWCLELLGSGQASPQCLH